MNELEKNDNNEQEGVKSFLSFILLENENWDNKRFEAKIKDVFEVEVNHDGEGVESTYIFKIKDSSVIVSLFNNPYPTEDIIENASLNYDWRDEAVEAAKNHKAHILVSVRGNEVDVLNTAALFVAIQDIVGSDESAIGIYTSGTVYLPDQFSYFAQDLKEDRFPILNLVWFGLYENENGLNCYTYGLEQFGKLEIEVLGVDTELNDLRVYMVSLVRYIVVHDVTLKDGETFGLIETDKNTITLSDGVSLPGKTFKLSY